jgi:hypothetical protein
MASLWPWVAVAGAGALHGLNPATGWAWVAACGARSCDARQALSALVPIALGHTISIAMVAAIVALGRSTDGVPLLVLADALLLVVVLLRVARRGTRLRRAGGGRTGLALWSFMVATAHGAGMMLVPALIPLCLGNSPAKEITASGSLLLAIAAVGVHTASMLAVTASVALGTCRGITAVRRRFGAGPTGPRCRRWTIETWPRWSWPRGPGQGRWVSTISPSP